MTEAAALSGGFCTPVFDSQKVFRTVLQALARPGLVQALPALATPPAPLSTAAGAIICALCDQDTPVWTDVSGSQRRAVADWVRFQTGAPVVPDSAAATFAVITESAGLPPFSAFAQGTSEYPDRSATLILQVAALHGGAPWLLEGPGVDGAIRIAPTPLPPDFAERMAHNHAAFPLGVDIILAAPDEIAALPRSTCVEAG